MNTSNTVTQSNAVDDMTAIGLMVAAGARAIREASYLGENDDDFTVEELEEMLAVSVCNNIDKDDQ